MITPQKLGEMFGLNVNVITLQTKELTHADSLLQLPFRGNCLNWVLGHIVANRNRVLELLDHEPIWSSQEIALYARESMAITPKNQERALPLERLLDDVARAQEAIADALTDSGPKHLSTEKDGRTIGDRVFFLYFHETYHVGQTELLRQLAGKDDHVI
jgi:hypothetical protein